jgi:beta-parvin
VFSGQKLDVIEVTQNEDLQKSKLRAVLDTVNRLLGVQNRNTNIKWSVKGIILAPYCTLKTIILVDNLCFLLLTQTGIHHKNTIEIIHLLVALIRHYRAPIRLPENVSANVVVVQVIKQ